jgi:HK97 family phage major capsid protein
MSLREQLKAALDRVAELSKAASERDLTDEELAEVDAKDGEITELREKIAVAEKAQDRMKALAGEDSGEQHSPVKTVDRTERADAKALGDAFVASAAYKGFRESHPSGFGQGTPIQIDRVKVGGLGTLGRKADPVTLQTDLAHPQPTRLPTVDLTYPKPLDFLDLISRGTMGGNSFEYLQITAVNRGAGIVADEILPDDADSKLKPQSDLSTNLADAKAYTYADGYTVTNMMLADAPALASYLNSQLGYNINLVIQDKIVNGTGQNGEPAGLLHTTGVQQQSAVDKNGDAASSTSETDIPTTVRKAVTSLSKIGAPITAVVMSPEDNETLDLMMDANERHYGNGPFSNGPNTLWGRPRVVSQAVQPGTVIVGNFATITLLDREGLSVLAFNQHKDFAQRNLVYVRAELRAAQAIFKPAELVVCDVAQV